MTTRSPLVATLSLCGVLAIATLLSAQVAVDPPTVATVTPTPIVVSASEQVLTVTGTNFAPGLTVEVMSQGNTLTFTGAAIRDQRATTFDIAVILTQPGEATLIVRNTDGGVSEPFPLSVVAGPAQPPTVPTVPVIDRIDPEKATRSTEAQALTLTGRMFARGVRITLTDPTGAVRILDTGAIEAVTPTSVRFRAVLDISGEYTFTATNPEGKASNTVTVQVT
jgi:hypothetical protein